MLFLGERLLHSRLRLHKAYRLFAWSLGQIYEHAWFLVLREASLPIRSLLVWARQLGNSLVWVAVGAVGSALFPGCAASPLRLPKFPREFS